MAMKYQKSTVYLSGQRVECAPAVPEALSSQTVAIYARFSNEDLQREASIQDQVRTCTDAAAENGWLVEPSLIFRDAGISGAQMSTRDGIQTL